MGRLSGSNFDIELFDTMIHVETASVTIDDGVTVTKTKGVPDGFVDGEVGADVEYEFDTKNFNLLIDAARSAGSFQELPAHDALFYGNSGDEEIKVELDSVKLKVSDLLNVDSKGGDKLKHKVSGFVTGSDFVKVNGVRYLSKLRTQNL